MVNRRITNTKIIYQYDASEVSYANLTEDEAKGIAWFISCTASALIFPLAVMETLEAVTARGVAEVTMYLAGAVLGLSALLGLVFMKFRYTVAVLLMALTYFVAIELALSFSYEAVIGFASLGVASAFLLLWPYPYRILLSIYLLMHLAIFVLLVRLARSSRIEPPALLYDTLWWIMLITGFIMLGSSFFFRAYRMRINEEEDRFARAGRDW